MWSAARSVVELPLIVMDPFGASSRVPSACSVTANRQTTAIKARGEKYFMCMAFELDDNLHRLAKTTGAMDVITLF